MLSCLFRWEETSKSSVKWRQLEHKGPYFTPAYEPLPDGVHFLYDGEDQGVCTPVIGLPSALG